MTDRSRQNSIMFSLLIAMLSMLTVIALFFGALGNPQIDQVFAGWLLLGSLVQSFVYLATVIRREETIDKRVDEVLFKIRRHTLKDEVPDVR